MHNTVLPKIWARKHRSQKLGLVISFGKKTECIGFTCCIHHSCTQLNSWKYSASQRKKK